MAARIVTADNEADGSTAARCKVLLLAMPESWIQIDSDVTTSSEGARRESLVDRAIAADVTVVGVRSRTVSERDGLDRLVQTRSTLGGTTELTPGRQ